MQFGPVVSIDRGASQTVAVGARYTGEQDTRRRCDGFAKIFCMRSEGEVGLLGIDDANGDRSGCIRVHIHKNSQMILELAEYVEATSGKAYPQDRTARLDQRAPGTLVSAAGVRVET